MAVQKSIAPQLLKAPFPYFGGKSKVASLVWSRLGEVKHYIEPFAGSLAVLLACPHPARLEVVGDANHYIANFWRAVRYQPEEVAKWSGDPVVHVDLTARHLWLTNPQRVTALRERLLDAEWGGDAQIAGWWVWGQSLWIGSGWCEKSGNDRIPHISDAGQGVQRATIRDQVPHISHAGQGVTGLSIRDQVPHIIDAGKGVARIPSDKIPQINDTGRGVTSTGRNNRLTELMITLSKRLQHTRIINGDWKRGMNTHYGTSSRKSTGVFLDPPYKNFEKLYADSTPVVTAVEKWARENGANPRIRIALCGHKGDYDLPGWDVVPWSRPGTTYKSTKTKDLECIWFSPHCLESSNDLLDYAKEID